MKCVIRQFEINAGCQPLGRESRSGATLVEILMSLLIMGIGLVSVASLFPIAVLRSIQATQLTNAALLNYQCEDYVRAFPGLTRNNFNGTNTIPNIEYTPASKAWRRIGVDETNTNDVFPPGGTPGNGVPDWMDFLALSTPKVVTVVDPVGVLLNSSGDATVYGKDIFNLHTVQDSLFQIDRKNGGFNFASSIQKNQALSMFSSNDSWSQAYSSIEVTKTSATVLTLADITAEDISVIQSSLSSNVTVRAVVFDVNGKQSHSSLIASTSGQTITLATAIPNNGMFNVISEVIIETFEPRYSCMITVRRQLMSLGPAGTPGEDLVDDDNFDGDNDNTTNEDDRNEIGWPGTDDRVRNIGANLVVFFRRDFSPLAEQVYEAGNLRKGLLVGQSTAQPQQVTIRWDSTNEDSKPKLKEGGFVFDVTNGYWYQIRTILIEQRASQNPRNTVNNVEAVILLDQPPQANGNFLMVPENVVEVFDYPGF
ncbi:MAG TPA: hypothetical protein DD473_09290 [Planctomycetaceae bacterium]|nr:hypothetical protein [Planctomycetaceae bacterium]